MTALRMPRTPPAAGRRAAAAPEAERTPRGARRRAGRAHRAPGARGAAGRRGRGDRPRPGPARPTSGPRPRATWTCSGACSPRRSRRRDLDLDAAVADADRALAEALAELGALRAERQARGEEAAALRRAGRGAEAEAETARRRLADAERRAAEETGAAPRPAAPSTRLEVERRPPRERLEAPRSRASGAPRPHGTKRGAPRTRPKRPARPQPERAAATGGRWPPSAGGSTGWTRRSPRRSARHRQGRPPARRQARRRGARRRADVRAAVEAALDEPPGRTSSRGPRSPSSRPSGGARRAEGDATTAGDGSTRRGAVRGRVAGAGGGTWSRRSGATRPAPRRGCSGGRSWSRTSSGAGDPADAAAGWVGRAATGRRSSDEHAVRLGGRIGFERRATADRLRVDVDLGRATRTPPLPRAPDAGEADEARRPLDEARGGESPGAGERRSAEEAERPAATRGRGSESGWQGAWHDRLAAEIGRMRGARRARARAAAPRRPAGDDDRPRPAGRRPTAASRAWEARVADLRGDATASASTLAGQDGARREAERRARAEAAAAIDEERIARPTARPRSSPSARRAAAEREGPRSSRRRTRGRRPPREALGELQAADAADRDRLAAAERAARARASASAQPRTGSAPPTATTSRRGSGSSALREQLLVELAGLGELGVQRLRPRPAPARRRTRRRTTTTPRRCRGRRARTAGARPLGRRGRGRTTAPAGRLGHLRRRYHELGAASPFAVDEYAELKARLETLETQEQDLRQAIAKTRELIAELNTMIADQFATTFRRWRPRSTPASEQLFGGGYAQLSMTDPTTSSATGIEIVARPPGKKAAGAGDAVGRRAGADRRRPAVRDARGPAGPVLRPRRGRRRARRGQRRPVRRGAARAAAATQFIVITHNRGTIEAADALYGVTVGDDSVSRVISLRLDEAQALAGRSRGRAAG